MTTIRATPFSALYKASRTAVGPCHQVLRTEDLVLHHPGGVDAPAG